jgi:L-alanine-DL-glutamate epimerase-like enolase superfamily enzyme
MALRLIPEPITLDLVVPFAIAHGTSTARHNVLVHVGDGIGEAALPPYYGVSQRDVIRYVQSIDPEALLGDDPLALEEMLDRLPPQPTAARAAVDIALHDHWARELGYPLYRLWGVNPRRAPVSSWTIPITADEDELRHRVRSASAFPILKLKLGSGNLVTDEGIVRVAREETDADLCVDANSAWQVDEAATIIPRLAVYDLLFIEQPLPRHGVEAWHELRSRLPEGMPPLIADESVQQAADIPPLAGAADGINVKVAKAGGLREGRRMISLARALGMQVMVGCMIETSVGVTAAAQLAPLADYADLDGNLLLVRDPYVGATLHEGHLSLPDEPGLGIRRRLF